MTKKEVDRVLLLSLGSLEEFARGFRGCVKKETYEAFRIALGFKTTAALKRALRKERNDARTTLLRSL